MQIRTASFLAFAAFAPTSVSQLINQCIFNSPNASYDLTMLSNPAAGYYKVVDKSNNKGSSNYTYYINICANVDPDNLPNAGNKSAGTDCQVTYPGMTSGPAPAFQYAEKSMNPGLQDKCHRLGQTLSDVSGTVGWSYFDATDPSRGVAITYSNGDSCGTKTSRSLKIWLECVPDALNIPDQEVVAETNDCFYEIFVPSAYGCPTECPINNKQLCSNHGLCGFDSSLKRSKCFCNGGYSGADCSQKAATGGGLTNVGGVLIGVGIFLLVTMGFL